VCLSVYDFAQQDFFDAVADVIHMAYPFKLIRSFEEWKEQREKKQAEGEK